MKGPTDTRLRSLGRRLGTVVAWLVVLEPLWMLLPFAGFLYGSVLPVQALSQHPATIWLVEFFLPTHTLFPLGLLLILAGGGLFLVGAGQVYLAKVRRAGLVTTGLYRLVRHPQYAALTLFGWGVLLTWGRVVTALSFGLMLWLYNLLAHREEAECLARFGEAYRAYRERTAFVLPGVRRGPFLPGAGLPGWGRGLLSFLLAVVLSAGGAWTVTRLRYESRETLPAQEYAWSPGEGKETVPLLLVKGPAMQAAPLERVREPLFHEIAATLLFSPRLAQGLAEFPLEAGDTLLVFVVPGAGWHSGLARHEQEAAVDAFVLVLDAPIPYDGANFRAFRQEWPVLQMLRSEDVTGETGVVEVQGPPRGVAVPAFQQRMEERVRFFLSGL